MRRMDEAKEQRVPCHRDLTGERDENAKQEAFWGPVEGRLMAMLDGIADLSLAQLNEATQAWVEQDYNRKLHSRLAAKTGMTIYRRRHIEKLVQMVAKAVGANPHGKLAGWGGALLWRMLQRKAAAA